MSQPKPAFVPTAVFVVGNVGTDTALVAKLVRNMLLRHGFIPYVMSETSVDRILEQADKPELKKHKLFATIMDNASRDGYNQFVFHGFAKPFFDSVCKSMGTVDPQRFHICLVQNKKVQRATPYPYNEDALKEKFDSDCITLLDTASLGTGDIIRMLDTIPKRKFQLEYHESNYLWVLVLIAVLGVAIAAYFA